MKWVPFTVHVKIIPENPGKRFELVRDMQKIASMAYEGLQPLVPSILSLAAPGGGQHTSIGGMQNGGLGGMTPGFAVKPQFGETPAQLMITGFYNTSNANVQPQPTATRISGNEIYESSASQAWIGGPNSIIDTQAEDLINSLETSLDSSLPNSVGYSIFRLDYSNVIYGDRGRHFPRT